MRIGTRTLKVIVGLSAALGVLAVSASIINLRGVLLSADAKGFTLKIADGLIDLSTKRVTNTGVQFTGPGTGRVGNAASQGVSATSGMQIVWLQSQVAVPLWLPALVSLGIGTHAFVTLRRRARAIKNGACPYCGYALIGIAPAAPCPECGRVKTSHG
jgi:hypothetical protein